MARITSYSLDQTITVSDKVVGTDAATGTVRNYTVGELSSFINTANLGNYDFDTTQIPGAGTDNFVLTYNNSTGNISLEVAASQAAFNLVEDLTPQLGGTLDANSQIIDMGANTITDTKVGQWDTAYGWGDHSTASYLTSETSHTDVLVDGDFGTAGLMTTNGSGTYSITTNNSSNWNTAYGWGDHSTEGYVTSSGVTGVTGTAPVVSSGGTAPAISMAAATTSVNGYLTSTDWNTFNGKQGSVTLTTTGSSGAATLVGTTLNIPQYGGGSGDVVGPSSATDNAIARFDTTTGKLLQNSSATMDDTGAITAPDFIGDLNGAVRFDAKAIGSAIDKGEVVYISGISGNTPEAQLARANSASTMPAFGIALEDIIQNDTGEIATFGSVKGLDVADFGETSITFSLGDTVYVSASEAGKLTNVPPSAEANLIQNIGKIERAAPISNMTIKVGGAGRTNATPNLDSAKMFLGNSSNKSVSVAMSGDVTISNTGATTVGTINSVAVATVTSGAALGATAQQPPSEGAFVDGDKTKLDAIEASADVTDATNVTAAGALMDSEMTDLAGVKGVTISTLQVKPSEGAFANGDKTKLDAIEASADVTDATNVTAAGALMDSEVTNLAAVKAFATTDYATAAQGLTADAALPKAGGAMTGAITGNQDITGKRPIVTDTTTTINLTLYTHEGTFIYSNNVAAVTVNILPNSTQAFPVGTEIDIIQAGGGQVTVTPGIGVNLNGANTAIPITAQWGGATLKQITADNWIIVGKI